MSNKGLIAGSFDILHPGYILLFEECKRNCEYLIVALHEDPSIERPDKNKPVFSIFERSIVLRSVRYVDEIVVYRTEEELENLIFHLNPDRLFVGGDYANRIEDVTGYKTFESRLKGSAGKHIYFMNRNHNWSATAAKVRIAEHIDLGYDLE